VFSFILSSPEHLKTSKRNVKNEQEEVTKLFLEFHSIVKTLKLQILSHLPLKNSISVDHGRSDLALTPDQTSASLYTRVFRGLRPLLTQIHPTFATVARKI
jgi:hypothetical protein